MREDTLAVVKMGLLSGGGLTLSLADIESYLRIASIIITTVLSVRIYYNKKKKDENSQKTSDKKGSN